MDLAEQSIVVAVKILWEFNRIQERRYWFSQFHIGKIATNVHIAMMNNIPFTDTLISSIAAGEEDLKEVSDLINRLPAHYKYISETLDDIFTLQSDPKGDQSIADSTQQVPGGIPQNDGQGDSPSGEANVVSTCH